MEVVAATGPLGQTSNVARFIRVCLKVCSYCGRIVSISIDLAIRAPRADCEDRSDPHLNFLHCISLIAIKVSWIIVPSFRTSLALCERKEKAM